MAIIKRVRPERLQKDDEVSIRVEEQGLLGGTRLELTRDGDVKIALSLLLTPVDQLYLIQALIKY